MAAMSEAVVNRYLKHATEDMFRHNRTEIRCPCRKCKLVGLINPFSGKLLEHLLMPGFMDGHTQWLSDEDDHEGNEAPATGNDHDNDHEEPPDYDGDHEHDHNNDNEEPPDHDGDDEVAEETAMEDETPLTLLVQDPHVQELLLKKITNCRAASRE